MKARPLLSDIQTSRLKFDPGDRILVRVSTNLPSEQYKSLERSVTKFAGTDVRILIVNCLRTRLLRNRNNKIETLVDETYAEYYEENLGVANISCSKIDFQNGDQLICEDKVVLTCKHSDNRTLIVKDLKAWLRNWIGSDVEVIIAKGVFS